MSDGGGDVMRWLSPSVAVLTVVGVAALGFAPTSAGLSGGAGSMPCRAVLGPIDNANLSASPTDDQLRAQQAWFVANGRVGAVGDAASAQEQAEAIERIVELCGDAQQTRSTWILLVAIFGSALALAARKRAAAVPTSREGAADA